MIESAANDPKLLVRDLSEAAIGANEAADVHPAYLEARPRRHPLGVHGSVPVEWTHVELTRLDQSSQTAGGRGPRDASPREGGVHNFPEPGARVAPNVMEHERLYDHRAQSRRGRGDRLRLRHERRADVQSGR